MAGSGQAVVYPQAQGMLSSLMHICGIMVYLMHMICYCYNMLKVLYLLQQTCESNIANRAKVVFQQKTGSRSFVAHIYAKVNMCYYHQQPKLIVI